MALSNSEISDVLVIGGGVIGMSIARELHKRGAGKVVLLERGRLGQESSFAAAGMLTPHADAEKRDFFFDFCCEGRDRYEDFAAELKSETGIDIELETSGTLSISFTEQDSEHLDRIYSWQHAAGFPVEKLGAAELLRLEPALSPQVRGGLFFPRDVQVENRLLVKALAASLERTAVEVFENAEVVKLLVENGKITGAEASNGNFFAPNVVLATGAWSSLIKIGENKRLALDVIPVRGQILSFNAAQKWFKRVIISPSGYLVPRADNRILAGATVEKAGFDNNVTTEGVQFLLKSAYEIAPGLKNLQIGEKWAGLRPESVDDLPILGEYGGVRGLFVATAHYRNGILLAPLTAQVISDQVLGQKTLEYIEEFSPNRFINMASA